MTGLGRLCRKTEHGQRMKRLEKTVKIDRSLFRKEINKRGAHKAE